MFCVAHTCKNNINAAIVENGVSNVSHTSFHRFPMHDVTLLQKWASAVQISDWAPTEDSFLCSEHFTDDSFYYMPETSIRVLKPNAVPSIFHDAMKSENVVDETSDSAMMDLWQSLLEFQKEDHLCDVALEADDGRVKAHGIVLAAASKVFKESLESKVKREEKVIVLSGLELEILKVVVHFAYTGYIFMPKKCVTTVSRVISVLMQLGFSSESIKASECILYDDDQSDEGDRIKIEEQKESFELESSGLGDLCIGDTTENDFDLQLTIKQISNTEQQRVEHDEKLSENTQMRSVFRRLSHPKLGHLPENSGDLSADELAETKNYRRLCYKCGTLFVGKHKCEPVECKECGIQCSTSHNLQRHMMLHTGERPHLCQHCGEGFIQRQSLQDHVTSYHPETVQNNPCIVGRQCPECGQMFYKTGQLQKHIRTRCGSNARMVGSADGSGQYENWEALKPYGCTKCVRRFKLKASLIIHDKVHSERKTFHRGSINRTTFGSDRRECHICGKKYMTAGELHEHVDGHCGESLDCKTCGRTFGNRKMLISHERVHTGEKPFGCSLCGKRFSHDSQLRNHVRVHTDEKPFECAICGKRVRQNAHLQSHMRTHTGEKPYRCMFCVKSYKNLVDLRFHYQRMHQFELPKRPGRRSFVLAELKEEQAV